MKPIENRQSAMIKSPTGLVLVSLFMSACSSGVATSGTSPAPTRAQGVDGQMVALSNEPYAGVSTIAEPVEAIWPRLLVAYELLDIPTNVQDPARYRLGNANYRPRRIGGQRLSKYIDCGHGATAQQNADTYAVTLSVITTLKPGEHSGETRVETLVQATGKSRATASRPMPCASKGQLEVLIAEMVGKG